MTQSLQSLAPLVQTRAGSVQGTSSRGVNRFLGIPYGQAVGEFGAFGALSDMPAWTGALDCTQTPPVFPQPPSRLASIMGDAIDIHPRSDQAFNVNVFAPHGAQGLPVLVFVHGGAFVTGAGGVRWYDGSALARHSGVVVVTINYRLGVWGNLIADGAPANNAVRDVIAALKWVAANIGAFGGNADNVTLSGQSAGATLSRLMTLVPEAKGLFRRAILLSCPGRIGTTKESAATATARVMELAGVANLRELAALSPDEVVRASITAFRETAKTGSILPLFRPMTDGELLDAWMDDSAEAAARAHCKDVMIGFTREEMGGFFWKEADTIGHDPDRVLGWYQQQYGNDGLARYRQAATRRSHATAYTQWVDGLSDQTFALPAVEFAAAYSNHGTAWLCRFDLQTAQPHLYAPHCIDLPFVFNNIDDWHDAPMLEGLPGDQVRELAGRVSNCVAHYAKHGQPGDDRWVPYTDRTPCIMSFDRA